MAHALEGYDGACREIHGHSYRLFVTVKGEPISDVSNPKYGMVMDFGELKHIVNGAIVDKHDHVMLIRRTESNKVLAETLKGYYKRIEFVDYQPTCENMVVRFADEISSRLPQGVMLDRIKLHETATSFAEWVSSDNMRS